MGFDGRFRVQANMETGESNPTLVLYAYYCYTAA